MSKFTAQKFRRCFSTAPGNPGIVPITRTTHGSIVPHERRDLVGERQWEIPMKRRDTWTIIAPDAKIHNLAYRNEPESIVPAHQVFTEAGNKVITKALALEEHNALHWRDFFKRTEGDILAFMAPFALFFMYLWD